jgi:tetratricopeptide (TPR) repeat protein/predicted Ser/Thr protein kinase
MGSFPDGYFRGFGSMDPARYREIKNLLMEALDQPRASRTAWLDSACGDDAALRRELDSLLAAEVAGSFLEHRPVEALAGSGEVDASGQQFGRIRLDRLIARGGMGEVYAGMDTLLQRPVAVKRMQSDLRLSAARRSAFLSEAQVLSGLRHPNICQVYDFFEDESQDLLVMELIDGRTLRELLDHGGVEDPIELAIQVMRGLVAAHERGIAHCDLKPENLMLSVDGTVKVLDFGLASTREILETPSKDGEGTRSTDSGAKTEIMGTPGYMAPEQARGEPGRTAADQWSFGLVLGELLTGRRLLPSDLDSRALIDLARQAKVSTPERLPRQETALLRSLLDPVPEGRPSARATLQALESIRGRSARRWRFAIAAGLVSLVVLATAKYTLDLQTERSLAVAAEQQAETARAEAEELAGYMIDELYGGLRSVGRLDLLEPVAIKAADYYGRLDDGELRGGRGEQSLALIRVAEVLDMQGHLGEATRAYQRAVDSLIPLAEAHPGDELIQYRRALAERNLGEVLRFGGDYLNSDPHALRAIAQARALVDGLEPGQGPVEEPTGEQRWSLLLRGLYLYADSLVRQGQSGRALELLDEAERLAVPAVVVAPALRRDLGDIQFKRCMAYYDSQQPDRVVSACRAAFDLDLDLYESSPDDVRLRRNLASAYWMLGRAERLAGEYTQALQTTAQGEAMARQLVEVDPDHAESHNQVAVLLISRAQIQQAMDAPGEAMETYRQVLSITQPLMDAAMDHATAHNHLIALTHLGRLDEARPLAREIFESGWRRPEFLDMLRSYDLVPASLLESSP